MALGWAAEMAPQGGQEALTALISQRMQMARDAEAVRQHQADEAIRQNAINENAAYRHDQFRSTDAARGAAIADKQAELFPEDTPVGPADQANWQKAGLGGMLRTRPLDATALPAASVPTLTGGLQTIGGLTSMPGPSVTGTSPAAQVPDTPVPGKPGDALSIPTAKNQNASEQQALRQQIADAKAEASANKGNTLTLSQGGKAVMRALETSGPLTDDAMAMMEKEFPDIAAHPEKYNKAGDLLQSWEKSGKYWLGMQDPDDPRMQIVNLLKPIQAGQYTQSSRSYKMVELALQHMADPRQTPARQYEAMRQLRSLMPELRNGVIRAERPIDLNNPNGNSYFNAPQPTTPNAAPPAAAAADAGTLPPKEQRQVGMKWSLPGVGPVTWTGAGWAPDAPPRPNQATPAPAGVADVPPAAPSAPSAPSAPPPLDSNRLPETGALSAPAPRLLGNRLSPAGASALKTREGGFVGDAYDDSGTGKAIGYGMHTFEGQPVMPGQHITQPQGDADFDRQIKATYGPVVDRALRVPVSQAQYDALVSMAWNLPAAARHVIDKINRGEKLSAADFQQSATVGGVANRGLQERRAAEASAFTKGTP